MDNCQWEEIRAFQSEGEYMRFVEWIEAQIQKNVCHEIPVNNNSLGGGDYRLFRCISCDAVWKLSTPDPGYFPGSWLPT